MRGAAFVSPIWLRNGHLQTVWSNWALRPARLQRVAHESSSHDVAVGDDLIRLHWWEHGDARRPVLVILHGLTGCSASAQVLGLADKALRVGFDILRVDLRNASGETPSREVGHAGRSEDVHAAIDWVRRAAPGRSVAVVGFSLGGNVALKAAGERGASLPEEVRALAVISAPIDLDVASRAIDAIHNWPYRAYFLRRLRRVVASRAARFPAAYAGLGREQLRRARTLRQFDHVVVARRCGFTSAEDYYARSSALGYVSAIDRPTLLIHAEDDPFVPATPYRDPRVTGNPRLELMLTRHGGHAGFWQPQGDDPFWAERQAVEFLRDRID